MKHRSESHRSPIRVLTALALTLSMLLTGSLLTYADENAKNAFLAAADALDPEGNYAERAGKVNAALEAYAKLTDGEKTDADVAAAKEELDLENGAVSAIADDAEAFISSVNAIADAADVMAKIAKIAEAGELYFEDTSYTGISAALETYRTVKAELEETAAVCTAFIGYVETAKKDWDEGEGYRTVKRSLDLATPLLDRVDAEYDRIATMKNVYQSLMSELWEIEQDNSAFVRLAGVLKEAKTYREISRDLGLCELAVKNVVDEDYDGIEEGKQAMEDARVLLAEKTLQAGEFASAVYDVIHAATFAERAEAMAIAKSVRAETDLTVPEAESADAELTRFEKNYADTVAYENAAMEAFLLGVFALSK